MKPHLVAFLYGSRHNVYFSLKRNISFGFWNIVSFSLSFDNLFQSSPWASCLLSTHLVLVCHKLWLKLCNPGCFLYYYPLILLCISSGSEIFICSLELTPDLYFFRHSCLIELSHLDGLRNPQNWAHLLFHNLVFLQVLLILGIDE